MRPVFFNLFRDVADAWKNLARRPLRSFLSSLGIGVGVTALLTMMSISEGARQTAMTRMNSLGIKTIRFENGLESGSPAGDRSLGLHYGDRELVTSWLGGRGIAGAYVRDESVNMMAGDQTVTTTVIGVDSTWFAAENYHVARGRSLAREDLLLQNKCAVVGARLAAEMGLELLSVIRLNNSLYTVVGIGEEKGRLLTEGTGLSTLDFDTSVYVPMTAALQSDSGVADEQVDGMVVNLATDGEDDVLTMAGQLHELLQREHYDSADFRMVIPYTLIQKTRENQHLFAVIMGAIASLSLLVGGIGVMNIMLANIAEQTREIGLRMAIGASRQRIVSLYLWNAVLLTFSGCCWGMALGVLAVLFISSYAGWDVAFSFWGLWLGPVSAILSGLLFGLHPALRAARLDPARALRES